MLRISLMFILIENSIPKPPKIINFTKPANHPNRRIKLPDIDVPVTVESVRQNRKDRAYFYDYNINREDDLKLLDKKHKYRF